MSTKYLTTEGVTELIKLIKKSDKEVKEYAQDAIKTATIEDTTGVITFTKLDGTTLTLDTLLEKVVTNFTYDTATEKLILTLEDGTTQEVALSAFIKTYTAGSNTETSVNIDTTSNNKITVSLVDGGIAKAKLNTALQANISLVEKFTDETTDTNLKFGTKEIAYKSDIPTEVTLEQYTASDITSLFASTEAAV